MPVEIFQKKKLQSYHAIGHSQDSSSREQADPSVGSILEGQEPAAAG